jgi:hypothetical protein
MELLKGHNAMPKTRQSHDLRTDLKNTSYTSIYPNPKAIKAKHIKSSSPQEFITSPSPVRTIITHPRPKFSP